VEALATEFCPTLSPKEVCTYTATALRKAAEGKPYRFSSQRIIEFLDIQPCELPALKTLITAEERKDRRKQRDAERNRGEVDRAAVSEATRHRQETALTLHHQGVALLDIARQIGCSVHTLERYLRA
jgi:hypothetical protein